MDMSIMQLIRKTTPFFLTRILVYGIFTVASVLFLALMVGLGFLIVKLFGEGGVAFFILIIAAISIVIGVLRFVERYFLYMVKLGHVAVIAELLRNGKVPEGKGMIAYGKDSVVENFGASNVAFVVDKMVKAAIRQIQRWLFRIGNLFKFIPGSQYVIIVVNAMMTVSLSYVDEAIMSYIFLQKSKKTDESVWKSATDGVVLYAQSWKGILKASGISVAFIYIFNVVIFLLFMFPLMFAAKMLGGGVEGLGTMLSFLALLGAYIFTTMIKRAIIDPVVTVIMIRSYQMSIRDMEVKVDLHDKLLGVSSKFKALFNKSKEGESTPSPSDIVQTE